MKKLACDFWGIVWFLVTLTVLFILTRSGIYYPESIGLIAIGSMFLAFFIYALYCEYV